MTGDADGFPPNPYQATSFSPAAISIDQVQFPPGMQRGMVGHVQILGVLMVVSGCINILIAIGTACYSILVPGMLEQATPNNGQPVPPEMITMLTLVTGILAAAFLAAAVANIYGGIRAIQFRSRVAVIVSLCSNALMLFSCYCIPTSAALVIYGLIVLLNPSTAFAFELRSRDLDTRTIQSLFLKLGRHV